MWFWVDDITTSRNEDHETKIIYLPDSHYTEGFEKNFKDFAIKVMYKTQKHLTIY